MADKMTQNAGKVLVLVTLIFNNVRGQSCPRGLYYTTVSDINDCIACPEQSIGCTADLNVKTLDNCLGCPFRSMLINATDEPSKQDTKTLKSIHDDAKSLEINIPAIIITIAAVVVILLVFVAVKYKKFLPRSQSTHARGNNVDDIIHNDVHVQIDRKNDDDTEEKKHLNPYTSEDESLLAKNIDGHDNSKNENWSQEIKLKDYATTDKGNLLAPENGTFNKPNPSN